MAGNTNRKVSNRLAMLSVGDTRRDPMISLVTRLLIRATVTVSVSAVAAILLIQKLGATWNVVPIVAFAIVVPARIAIAVNYLYWRPRYRVPERASADA